MNLVEGQIYKLVGVDYYVKITRVPEDNSWLVADKRSVAVDWSPDCLNNWAPKGYILVKILEHDYEYFKDESGIKVKGNFPEAHSRLQEID